MRKDLIPVEIYVHNLFQQNRVITTMIQPWRVEVSSLHEIVIKSLREMGIYLVDKEHGDFITQATLDQLKHSPEIRKMITRAEQLEQSKKRSQPDSD